MEFNKKNIRTIVLIIFSCILFYLGIKNIGIVADSVRSVIGVVSPFILGAAIAFILNVPMTRIEYWLFHRTIRLEKGRRALSFVLTLALVIGVIIIAMYIRRLRRHFSPSQLSFRMRLTPPRTGSTPG